MFIYTMYQATKWLKDRTTLTDVEQPSQIPYLLYTTLNEHRFPQFGTCGVLPPQIFPRGLFQRPSPAIYTYMIIYI